MCGVAGGTVLAVIALAIWMLAQIVFEVLRERGGVSGDLAALPAVPDGDATLVGVGRRARRARGGSSKRGVVRHGGGGPTERGGEKYGDGDCGVGATAGEEG